jgi:hypothetical protein
MAAHIERRIGVAEPRKKRVGALAATGRRTKPQRRRNGEGAGRFVRKVVAAQTLAATGNRWVRVAGL